MYELIGGNGPSIQRLGQQHLLVKKNDLVEKKLFSKLLYLRSGPVLYFRERRKTSPKLFWYLFLVDYLLLFICLKKHMRLFLMPIKKDLFPKKIWTFFPKNSKIYPKYSLIFFPKA